MTPICSAEIIIAIIFVNIPYIFDELFVIQFSVKHIYNPPAVYFVQIQYNCFILFSSMTFNPVTCKVQSVKENV